jgi:hypothetical protein
MTATFDRRDDVITSLSPGGDPGLAALSDDELLANTRRLVGKSNQLLAVLLVHLAEVEVRGAHRTRRCASLYTYCIYELRFSEDEAARRSAAARLVKQFPPLFRAIADGELHLTGLLMIGPHLTPENHVEVLKRLRNPTWEQYVSARAPQVRELPEGERPRDWANDDASPAEALLPEPLSNEALPVGPAPRDLPPVTGPQHYQLQFSTTEEHAQLVDRAKALLARSRPGMSLGELHLEAMRLLVASLERRRFGAAEPRYRPPSGAERPGRAADQRGEADPAQGQRGESEPAPRQRSECELAPPSAVNLTVRQARPRISKCRLAREAAPSRQLFGARCFSVMVAAAVTSTRAANGVARCTTWSFTTCSHSPRAGPTSHQTSRCVARRTMPSLRKRTLEQT